MYHDASRGIDVVYLVDIQTPRTERNPCCKIFNVISLHA